MVYGAINMMARITTNGGPAKLNIQINFLSYAQAAETINRLQGRVLGRGNITICAGKCKARVNQAVR